jgi:hypothetical protein
VADYGVQVGLPVESTAFVTHMRTWLEEKAIATDAAFPTNTSVRFVEGEPVLRKLPKHPTPRDLKAVEQCIAARIEPVNILDVLTDTDAWLQWTRFFGLLSGRDARLDDAGARYIATTFCYGCNLGPTQTAQSLNTFSTGCSRIPRTSSPIPCMPTPRGKTRQSLDWPISWGFT